MRHICIASVLLTAIPVIAQAQSDDDQQLILHGWNVTGEAGFSADYFAISGNSANSPFAFDGFHGVSTLNADFSRPDVDQRSIKGSLSMSADASDYFEASDNAMTLERLRLEYANGAGSLPYRLELGDFFGFYSRRTLQRGLKGAQIEFQPLSLQSETRAASLQFSGGNTASTYNLIGENNASFVGSSFVVVDQNLGSLAVNLVHGSQAPFDGSGNTLNQWVGSVAGARNLVYGGQILSLESELSILFGDVNNGNLVRDERAVGLNFSFNGRDEDSGLTYGVRMDRFSDGFAPLGGQATADRFSAEGNIAYRFESGYNVRFSGSEFQESLTADKTIRRSIRGSVSGPVLDWLTDGWNGSADIFRTHTRNQSVTTKTTNWTGVANLAGPIADGYTASIGLFGSDNDNLINNANDAFTYQITSQLNHRRKVGDFNLSVGGGIAFRYTAAQTDQAEIGPTANLGITRDNHSLRLSYSHLDTRSDGGNAVDVITDNLTLNYAWSEGPHRLEARGGYFSRTANAQEQTDTLFVGMSYSFRFGQSGQRTAFASATIPSLSDSLKLGSLPPGIPARTADIILPALGLKGKVGKVPLFVEEINVYPVPGRQRFILTQANGLIIRAGVVVETLGLQADDLDRQLDDLEDLLTRRYGAPRQRVREGASEDFFGAGAELPIRVTDWRLPSGGTLRLGIPPRFGQQPRIEVVSAQTQPADLRSDWGFADVN